MNSASADLLQTIVAATKRIVEVRAEGRPFDRIERMAADAKPRAEAFRAALVRTGSVNVIAECKRRSPSGGVLRHSYDPVAIARSYEQAGAAAISVLTEPTFFDGSLDHVSAVRAAVGVPVLRKDFIVSEYQIVEARAAGADAILLIVASLSDGELNKLHVAAVRYQMAPLVEVHDALEFQRALDAGAMIVGVNNRNLKTLEVDMTTSTSLIGRMPPGVAAVAESGLRSWDDIRSLREAGYNAFLVGERLMTSGDPGEALRKLLGR